MFEEEGHSPLQAARKGCRLYQSYFKLNEREDYAEHKWRCLILPYGLRAVERTLCNEDEEVLWGSYWQPLPEGAGPHYRSWRRSRRKKMMDVPPEASTGFQRATGRVRGRVLLLDEPS
jgi:hypothetical protein